MPQLITLSFGIGAGLVVGVSAGDLASLLRLQLNGSDVLLAFAIWIWALYIAMQRRIPASIHPLAFLFATAVVGEVFIGLLYLSGAAGPLGFDIDPGKVAGIVYIAVFPTAIAYLMWNKGIALVGADAGAQSQYLIPVFGSFFAMMFLGEAFQWFHGVGICLILWGIYMSISGREKSTR